MKKFAVTQSFGAPPKSPFAPAVDPPRPALVRVSLVDLPAEQTQHAGRHGADPRDDVGVASAPTAAGDEVPFLLWRPIRPDRWTRDGRWRRILWSAWQRAVRANLGCELR